MVVGSTNCGKMDSCLTGQSRDVVLVSQNSAEDVAYTGIIIRTLKVICGYDWQMSTTPLKRSILRFISFCLRSSIFSFLLLSSHCR